MITAIETRVPVLIVDDDASKRLAIKAVLAPLGYQIVEADGAIEALRNVLAQDFAVILLDVRMPIADGFETAALIRRRRQSETTPIIFITGYAGDELARTDRYAQGAVDFMFAPVAPDELRAKVQALANLFVRAEELAEQARAVQESADQVRVLTDAAPIGIFRTDAQNCYVYTNPRWTEIAGISSETATGRPWDFILAPGQRAALLTELASGTGQRAALGHRFEIQVPGAAPRIVLLTSKAIPDSRGAIAGWVGTLADVTAEAGAEAAMSVARDTAVAAGAEQRNLTASASHELRTPIASILGFVEEILENDAMSAEDRGFLDVVYRNAQRLNQLVDDLLILDQAEVGGSKMVLEPTRLPPLVARVMSIFTTSALRAEIVLTADHEADAPMALIDPLRFEQALTNLVSNALKFTPSGGRVSVGVRSAGESVEVRVADTGAGIDPAELGKIFDRFYRTQSAVDTAVKGSGLGLTIARAMIEAQNGELRVTSSPGAGSTFTMSVPIASRQLQVVE